MKAIAMMMHEQMYIKEIALFNHVNIVQAWLVMEP